jgi:hypothetical protein
MLKRCCRIVGLLVLMALGYGLALACHWELHLNYEINRRENVHFPQSDGSVLVAPIRGEDILFRLDLTPLSPPQTIDLFAEPEAP